MILDIGIIVLLFLFGLIIGHMAVIVGIKFPLKRRNLLSCCDNCNEKYKWYEMIPIVSFFIIGGECPYCEKQLSLGYPILELICSILLPISYMLYGFCYEMIAVTIIIILTTIIYVCDFKYYIILDGPLIIFSVIILVLQFILNGFEEFLLSLCSGILMFLLFYAIKLIGDKIFKTESLGGGDVKLSMFFGFVVGLRLGIISIIVGSLLAFPVAIYYSFTNGKKEIPFGPFLITGLLIVFIFMEQINSFINVLFK
jgi:prepilin signal peptidase PulO-like enzyme (type II secretory pathway)